MDIFARIRSASRRPVGGHRSAASADGHRSGPPAQRRLSAAPGRLGPGGGREPEPSGHRVGSSSRLGGPDAGGTGVVKGPRNVHFARTGMAGVATLLAISLAVGVYVTALRAANGLTPTANGLTPTADGSTREWSVPSTDQDGSTQEWSVPRTDQDGSAQEWSVPRTAHGYPDLQGNWSNATLTPIQREEDAEPTYTWEEVAEIEGWSERVRELAARPSDPNRPAPPKGGIFTGNASYDAASGGTGGYNNFYIDSGDRVAIFNGEPRRSLLTRPDDGRVPGMTEEGRARRRAHYEAKGTGSFDNPENRSLAERCLMSFGSNAGPPMLPNYFYNNSYTIVQTPDHVAILTEMVHDVRIIRLGEPSRLPKHIRPWMGESWGHWEGDTLVVVTTNIHPDQVLQGAPPSEEIKITERFTRASEHTINYEFTVEDPVMWREAWGGELPFHRMEGLVYEYACHEGNYSLENVLRGARAEEREPGY